MGASVSSLTGKSTTHAPHAQGSAAGAGPGAQAARRVEGGSWLARKSYVAMVPLKPFAPPQRPGRRAGLSRDLPPICVDAVSYTHLRAHETRHDLVCRLLLE